MTGTLFVIATPLGNLGDLSPRAQEILSDVALIACEDTRRTRQLLQRYGIGTRLVSYHRFNERVRLEPVLDQLRDGGGVALVSDGGTPAISDPGCLLVSEALAQGISVSPIPGPSAVACLLSVSGLPADRYVFEGFLPHRGGERRRRLRELRSERRTLVAFEAPHRICATLDDLATIFGDRQVVLGRELTKQFETILRGTPAELKRQLGTEPRGEITLVIAGATEQSSIDTEPEALELINRWRRCLDEAEGDRRAALRSLAKQLGEKRPELFRRLTELGEIG